jgi:hypothetical protein
MGIPEASEVAIRTSSVSLIISVKLGQKVRTGNELTLAEERKVHG